MVYSTGRFVFALPCVILFLYFFCPFSIAITSTGEERVKHCFSYVFMVCACLVLSISASISCYDCDTPWISFLPFLFPKTALSVSIGLAADYKY